MQLVLIAESEPSFGLALRAHFEGRPDIHFDQARTLGDVKSIVQLREPDVVLIGPSVEPDSALCVAQELTAEHPNTAFVLVVKEVSTGLLHQALRSGLRDVVSASEAYDDVARSVSVALASTLDRRSVVHREVPADRPEPARRGRVATVFSTKGGVGKTVIASNISVALASTLKRSVVLIDLDLQFGDTGIVLNLVPERTIYDALQVFDRLDAEMIKGFLTEHECGLKVLLAPIRPEEAEFITVSRLGAVIDLLREIADFVVIDTAAAFDDVVLAAIDRSDDVFAVATMDVASIKNTRVSLQKLGQMGYDSSKVHLVLNRADSKVWLDPDEVERIIAGRAVVKIPSDRLVPRSVNRGVPVVLDSPRSGVAHSLVSLAELVASSGDGGSE